MEDQKVNVVQYSVTDAALVELREQYKDLPDLSMKEGYELVRSGIATTRRLRGEVETRRKELKEGALEWGRKVDSEAKRITTALLEIEEPLKQAKAEHDAAKEREKEAARQADEARKDSIRAKIDAIRMMLPAVQLKSHGEIEAAITTLGAITIDESFGEFQAQANAVMDATVAGLKEATAAALVREEEAARLAEERARLAVQRENLAKQQAELEAEQAKAKEEAASKAKAEQETLRKAKEEAAAEERARLAKEREELAAEQEKVAAAKKKASEEAAAKARAEQELLRKARQDAARQMAEQRRSEMFAEAVAYLEGTVGLTETQATVTMVAISSGVVPWVSFSAAEGIEAERLAA